MNEHQNRDLQEVPTGLEQLLLMAGVDPRFRVALMDARHQAAEASGVALTPTERTLLDSVDGALLGQLAQKAAQGLDAPNRRAFLAQASAALVLLAGGGMMIAGCGEKKSPAPAKDAPPPTDGNRSTNPRPVMLKRKHRRRLQAPTGIRPNPHPRLLFDKITVKGPLAHQEVRRTLMGHSGEVKRCWDGGLKSVRGLRNGRVRLDFTIDARGGVSKPVIGETTLNDPKVERCLLEAAKKWTFPKPSKAQPTDVQVSYQFYIAMFP